MLPGGVFVVWVRCNALWLIAPYGRAFCGFVIDWA